MIRWLVWSLYVVAWTIALEFPVTTPGDLPRGDQILTYKLIFAKILHVCAYGLLTGLSAWMPLPSRFRPILMFFLMGHATATELMQETLEAYCHRTGSLGDIGFDHLGITLGLLLTWKWWTRPDNEPRPPV